jgi:BMFP domain-containing protein YqiC
MTEQNALTVLAQRIGELESENAQLIAELAISHHLLAAAATMLAELRKRLPVLEAAAGYERPRAYETR